MGFRYAAAAWDTDIKALQAQHGPFGKRGVSASTLKLLLIHAAEYANNETGAYWPALATIQHDTGLDRRTAGVGLQQLVHLGVLELMEEARQHRPASYRLLVPRSGDPPPLEPDAADCTPSPDAASRPPDAANDTTRGGDSPARGGTRASRGGASPPDPEEPEEPGSENPDQPEGGQVDLGASEGQAVPDSDPEPDAFGAAFVAEFAEEAGGAADAQVVLDRLRSSRSKRRGMSDDQIGRLFTEFIPADRLGPATRRQLFAQLQEACSHVAYGKRTHTRAYVRNWLGTWRHRVFVARGQTSRRQPEATENMRGRRFERAG